MILFFFSSFLPDLVGTPLFDWFGPLIVLPPSIPSLEDCNCPRIRSVRSRIGPQKIEYLGSSLPFFGEPIKLKLGGEIEYTCTYISILRKIDYETFHDKNVGDNKWRQLAAVMW